MESVEPLDREPLKIIALDGPAGSGKSTVAKRLADALTLAYLDTGAMYRSVAFVCLQQDVDVANSNAVADASREATIELGRDGSVTVNGIDATAAIRGPEVTTLVSHVASNPEVRAEMVGRQRAWAVQHGGGVLEGRDIGTVVFPDALLKIYLTARPEVRAARRANEASTLDVKAIEADIARRDALDSSRDASPLRRADDAIELDTSDIGIEEVVDLLVTAVADRLAELAAGEPQ